MTIEHRNPTTRQILAFCFLKAVGLDRLQWVITGSPERFSAMLGRQSNG